MHIPQFPRCFLYLFVLQIAGKINCIQRNLICSINPGCNIPQCTKEQASQNFFNLVHIEAVGPNDTLHYLWSTYKLPSVIVAKTSHTTSLDIDWQKFLLFAPGAITFSEDPICSIGADLAEFYQFVDPKDTADIAKAESVISLNITDFLWGDINETLACKDSFATSSPEFLQHNGSFKIVFSVSGNENPTDDYPHLRFTSNSTQMRILLNDVPTENEKSRFAVQIMAMSQDNRNEWQHAVKESINDEYSPGVFKVHNMLHSSCNNNNTECKGFLNWKPVAYIGETPTVANSSDATMSNFINSNITVYSSIATAYFGNKADVSKVVWNITFGSSGDGFYMKTKYTSWSLMIGLGEPSMENMSILAIVVISVGLGAPLLIMVGGVGFLGYKRLRQKDKKDIVDEDDDETLING